MQGVWGRARNWKKGVYRGRGVVESPGTRDPHQKGAQATPTHLKGPQTHSPRVVKEAWNQALKTEVSRVE